MSTRPQDLLRSRQDERMQFSEAPASAEEVFARKSPDFYEMLARATLRGVPLLPVPAWSRTLVAGANNSVVDINVPDMIQVIGFRALATVDFSVSFGTRCVMPRTNSEASETMLTNDGIISPLGLLFYIRDFKRISVGIAALNAQVSIFGFQQL